MQYSQEEYLSTHRSLQEIIRDAYFYNWEEEKTRTEIVENIGCLKLPILTWDEWNDPEQVPDDRRFIALPYTERTPIDFNTCPMEDVWNWFYSQALEIVVGSEDIEIRRRGGHSTVERYRNISGNHDVRIRRVATEYRTKHGSR